MIQIFLDRFRSFATPQTVPVRPLTLLVGENSSGKSSFLAAVASLCGLEEFPSTPNFNQHPYDLGTFDTIATLPRGDSASSPYFSLGFAEKDDETTASYREKRATYVGSGGVPILQKFHANNTKGSLSIRVNKGMISGDLEQLPSPGGVPVRSEILAKADESWGVGSTALALQVLAGRRRKPTTQADYDQIREFLYPFRRKSVSIAPIRTRPQRTYDLSHGQLDPDGEWAPSALARLLGSKQRSSEATALELALRRFGNESGLFKAVRIRRLGRPHIDPFQIQVTIAGVPMNLADVGYGVSQSLPLVVQSILHRRADVLLVQQPEVHLHPRAQAAVGSFYAELAAKGKRLMLVETHSDYLVDRVRQEVARGTIRADRVQILFFHKPKLETTVYPIGVDASGNVLDAPTEYRAFFLGEQMELFRRTSA